jgi:histidine triad (HIT) family protein
MSEDTIFGKIIRREIPADIVHEDDVCLAFRDVNPQAPTHVLVIPKQPIPKLADAGPEDKETLGHMLLTVKALAEKLSIAEDGYRVVINTGKWRPNGFPPSHAPAGGSPFTMAAGLGGVINDRWQHDGTNMTAPAAAIRLGAATLAKAGSRRLSAHNATV